MSTFSFIKKIFGGDDALSSEEQTKLFEELLLLTLARASRSDLDISPVEVNAIQTILKDKAGLDTSEKDIRLAAMSELYEEAPLEGYVASAAPGLTVAQRSAIVSSLFSVIAADEKVTAGEAAFFNDIANAMDLSPVELMGAEVDD
ncbi:MAG: TerB family tellurite resistance protein [Pseudomonadota bacterium]